MSALDDARAVLVNPYSGGPEYRDALAALVAERDAALARVERLLSDDEDPIPGVRERKGAGG